MSGTEIGFDLDHLYQADEWQQPGSTIRQDQCKLIGVSLMPKGGYTDTEIDAEMAKCRLLHADCHQKHSNTQRAERNSKKRKLAANAASSDRRPPQP